MLLADIIRIGQPIVESSMPLAERIELLTDVAKEEAKNFYGNIFVVEIKDDTAKLHYQVFQDEINGPANLVKAVVAPITLPSGNPIHAQGIYPLPSYPLYDLHTKNFPDVSKTHKFVVDRFARTLPYLSLEQDELEHKATLVAHCLTQEGNKYLVSEKQLGVLLVVDHSLSLFSVEEKKDHFKITLDEDKNNHLYIDAKTMVDNIIQARFEEAKELGTLINAHSTILNQPSKELVSAYNKGWLWLSHTWDLPKSIYWGKKEWVKGIRLNRQEHQAFIYGAQFLKQIQTPIRGAILKEMFAPTFSAEAKQHMRATSFETLFGIPYFLPLTTTDTAEIYTKFQHVKKLAAAKEVNPNDLHLEIISGLKKRIIPALKDDYRLSVIYYSGNLGRGDIHIRSQIEDVVPSIATKVQEIIRTLERLPCTQFADLLGIATEQQEYTKFKVKFLPTLLSNAYGTGYLWASMEQVLHGYPIEISRVTKQTMRRITELANKENLWGIRLELLFYYLFTVFYREYHQRVLNQKKGGVDVQTLQELLERYREGNIDLNDLSDAGKVGFISGCLVQQFGRSYYAKIGRDYLKSRIMRFGGKLNPEMIWKNGLINMEELRRSRDLGIAQNYEKVLALALPAVLALKKNDQLLKKKDEFMTMFWSGYLMLPRIEKEV